MTIDDLHGVYDGSKHPDVVAGKKTSDDVLNEFIHNFEQEPFDGIITLDEFQHYYVGVSASIEDDDYFELMIRNAWMLPGNSRTPSSPSSAAVLVTGKDGSQSVHYTSPGKGGKTSTHVNQHRALPPPPFQEPSYVWLWWVVGWVVGGKMERE